jgi:hypothetical protein
MPKNRIYSPQFVKKDFKIKSEKSTFLYLIHIHGMVYLLHV